MSPSSLSPRRSLRHLSSALLCGVLLPAGAHAQARYTASRAGDLQIGGGYSSANAAYEYVGNRIRGFYFYTDFDFREHFGVSASFHQLNDPNSAVYQRSYEAGGRYVRHYAPGGLELHPYARLQGGRGVLNFPRYANLAYNMIAGAGGVDISVHPRINLRAEFEYQHWFSAPGAGLSLEPSMVSVGAAYHFGPGTPRRARH